MTKEAALALSPIHLAYLGDSVFDLMVRESLIETGERPREMHRLATTRVNAAAQAQTLVQLTPMLTDEEQDIVRRGRNCHTHQAPRKQNPADYAHATALEALFGYLYITGQRERLAVLFAKLEGSPCPLNA